MLLEPITVDTAGMQIRQSFSHDRVGGVFVALKYLFTEFARFCKCLCVNEPGTGANNFLASAVSVFSDGFQKCLQ